MGNLAIVGLYFILHSNPLFTCIETLIRENIKTKGEFQLTDALQMMLENGEPLSTFPVNNWYDCGKPETLLSTNETLLKEHSSKSSIRGCIINEPAFISKSAQINNAIIGPNTSIGENVIIEDAIIENSIIGNFSKVQHVSLNKSIIGNNVDLSGDPHEANIGDFSEIKLR